MYKRGIKTYESNQQDLVLQLFLKTYNLYE